MFERRKKPERQPEKKPEKKQEQKLEQKQQQKQEQKQEQRVMSKEESAALINDPVFRGRVKVACLQYADSILANPSGRTFTVLQWGRNTLLQPDQAAGNVVGATVIDGAVQSAGKNVTDEDLQRAVEVQVNKIM